MSDKEGEDQKPKTPPKLVINIGSAANELPEIPKLEAQSQPKPKPANASPANTGNKKEK